MDKLRYYRGKEYNKSIRDQKITVYCLDNRGTILKKYTNVNTMQYGKWISGRNVYRNLRSSTIKQYCRRHNHKYVLYNYASRYYTKPLHFTRKSRQNVKYLDQLSNYSKYLTG